MDRKNGPINTAFVCKICRFQTINNLNNINNIKKLSEKNLNGHTCLDRKMQCLCESQN